MEKNTYRNPPLSKLLDVKTKRELELKDRNVYQPLHLEGMKKSIRGGVNMATSSITKNFIISGQKQVEMFADAIEASANDRTPRVPINVTYLQGTDNILKFMERRKKADATTLQRI